MARAMEPAARKAAIIEAATSCFAEKGYHATAVSDIIDRAGIARGTFYLYFKSKHDIFQCILDEFIEHLDQQIRIIELGGEKSPALQMRDNAERVIDAIQSRPGLSKIVFNEAVGLDPSTQERLRLFYQRLLEIIQSSIRRGISFGLVREVDEQVASCIILGAVREIITQNSVFGNTRIDPGAMVDGLLDVLVGGLGTTPMLA